MTRTVVLGENPEVAAVIERRRRLGLDRFDEVWEGEYHMAPAAHGRHSLIDQQLAELLGPPARRAGLVASGPFNLGDAQDFRVPDRGLHRQPPSGVWIPTAAMVVEIVSPDDETYAKFEFYADHDVDEILVVDPVECTVRWFRRTTAGWSDADSSSMLELSVVDLAAAITWPA